MNREQMDESNQEIDEAIRKQRINLNLDTIQARMLLTVHRVGTVMLTKIIDGELENVDSRLAMEAAMFSGIGHAYPEQSEGLRNAMINFDVAVGEHIKGLCHGVIHDHLVEVAGEDIASALTGKKKKKKEEEEEEGE